jgi:hypothetical protein
MTIVNVSLWQLSLRNPQTLHLILVRWSGIRIPAETREFGVLSILQAGSGVQPASYSIGTGVLAWGKAISVCSWSVTLTYCQGQVWLQVTSNVRYGRCIDCQRMWRCSGHCHDSHGVKFEFLPRLKAVTWHSKFQSRSRPLTPSLLPNQDT